MEVNLYPARFLGALVFQSLMGWLRGFTPVVLHHSEITGQRRIFTSQLPSKGEEEQARDHEPFQGPTRNELKDLPVSPTFRPFYYLPICVTGDQPLIT